MTTNFERPWVILVDDDEDDRFLIHQAFQLQGVPTLLQALASGEELFQLLTDTLILPSLVLLDLNMPLMNGFDVLQRLAASVEYRAIPVVVLTTSEADEDRQNAFKLGARHFVTKPPTLTELSQVVTLINQNWLVKQ